MPTQFSLTEIMNKEYITEIWPNNSMTIDRKLNAISRLIIGLSILGFLFSGFNIRFILIGIITLLVMVLLYRYKKFEPYTNLAQQVKLDNVSVRDESTPISTVDYETGRVKLDSNTTLKPYLQQEFHPVGRKNPMGNVLLTEIMDNPDRKSAPPSFNPEVYDEINSATKKAVQRMNPDIKNTSKQLYGDLASNFEYDLSMRNFYTMPNTRVTNDQGAFQEYLYGTMPSAKGDSFLDNQQREKDNYRYILI
jgi:hypothetical protein